LALLTEGFRLAQKADKNVGKDKGNALGKRQEKSQPQPGLPRHLLDQLLLPLPVRQPRCGY
jgi:hypothetical protein